MFAQLGGVTSPAARCMSVLIDLPSGERAANTPLSRQGGGEDSDGSSVLTAAVSRLGAQTAAAAAVAELAAEATAAQGPEQGLLLLRHVNAAERNAEFGAQLSLILKQETLAVLPPGARHITPAAQRVWDQLRTLRSRMHHVRTLAFTELVPHGVEVDKLVKAAECGSVTADLLAGSAAKAKRGEALLLAWPAFVELADDVSPADFGARRALVQLARLAFANSAAQGEALVTRVLQKYAVLSFNYRGGFESAAPRWRTVIDDAMRKAAEESSAASLSRGGSSGGDASAALTTARTKSRADNAAIKQARKELKEAEEALSAAPADAAKKAAVEAAKRAVKSMGDKADASAAALAALQ